MEAHDIAARRQFRGILLFSLLSLAAMIAAAVGLSRRGGPVAAPQPPPPPPPPVVTPPPFVPAVWQVLGPFPVGTREYTADPLQSPVWGGIFALALGANQSFPSDWADGGSVTWSQATSDADGNVNIPFSSVRWSFNEQQVGAVGGSFQAWAVGSFVVNSSITLLAQFQGVREVYLDSRAGRFIGDIYGTGNVWVPLALTPGAHTFYVRVMGAEGGGFRCLLQPAAGGAQGLMALEDDQSTDLVNGTLASPWVSVVLLNVDPTLTVNVTRVTLMGASPFFDADVAIVAPSSAALPLLPRQAQPLVLRLNQTQPVPVAQSTFTLQLAIFTSRSPAANPLLRNVTLNQRLFPSQAYKFTFLDFDGSLQYCTVLPPAAPCGPTPCSILFSTHGAGVPADEMQDPAWAGAYQAQSGAFILLPTNRRPFGFDWQWAGLRNALAALQNFADALPGVPAAQRAQYMVNPQRLLFGGHSMGGHGCWLLSTHFADWALGAAPAAGWIDYELYQPYFTRVGYDHIDPFLRGVVEAAMAHYDTALHISNLLGVDVLARMGGDDDNVPPFHMRRMARLQIEQGGRATVSEVPGQGHWFDGVVDDAVMQSFYDTHLYAPKPALPENFTFTCVNPAVCGSRGGIALLQSHYTARLARVHVVRSVGLSWQLRTENARRLQFLAVDGLPTPATVQIDGGAPLPVTPTASFCQSAPRTVWAPCTDAPTYAASQRSPATYGPVEMVLLQQLCVVIGTGTDSARAAHTSAAMWLSQNWLYQGRGRLSILTDAEFNAAAPAALPCSNAILLGGPVVNSATQRLFANASLPLSFSGTSFSVGGRNFTEPAQGVLALLPFAGGASSPALMAVAAGVDEAGFSNAFNLVPLRSGETTPDWAVTGEASGWLGEGALLAAGFWDALWNFDPVTSYVR
jgi:dienelactone hydrolase